MITDKIILNKIYLYAGNLHKIKKIQKTKNKIFAEDLRDSSVVEIPLQGSDLLLTRMYTIGEVSKIIERKPDTIRKYEKNGLLPKPSVYTGYPSYHNWRFYTLSEVYDMIDFFADRTPGRPVTTTKKVWSSSLLDELKHKTKSVDRAF